MGTAHEFFRTGAAVPETGIYRVHHDSHRLPHEVVILKDEIFPRCSKCSEAVHFELAHAAPGLSPYGVYRIYELPAIEADATAA